MSTSQALAPYKSKLAELDNQVIYLTGQRDQQTLTSNKHLAAFRHAESEIEILKEVVSFFSGAITDKIEEVQHTVEDLINKGLQYVFQNDDIGIKLSTEFKNNKTLFVITLSDGKTDSTNMLDSFGGGLVSIVSFLFKVIVSIINRNEKFMIFDETLNFVSIQYQEPLSKFIRQLCEDMGITLVLITHQPAMAEAADIVYDAYEAKGGSTKFKRIDKKEPSDATV